MNFSSTLSAVVRAAPDAHGPHLTSPRDTVLSLITHGYAVVKMPVAAQSAVWSALDNVSHVSEELRQDFSFADRTDGFLLKGGERAKYTENIDLCDRFFYWHKHRAHHADHVFVDTLIYQNILRSEAELWRMAQSIIDGLWNFFATMSEWQSVRARTFSFACTRTATRRTNACTCKTDTRMATWLP